MSYETIVLHSGGMDSSLCLLLAVKEYGSKNVISLGFRYHQRHETELKAADMIAAHYGVRREVIDMPLVPGWESSSLISRSLPVPEEPFAKLATALCSWRRGHSSDLSSPIVTTMGFVEIGALPFAGTSHIAVASFAKASEEFSIHDRTSSAGCPNSIVTGRNGLFLMMASPLAKSVGAEALCIGVMEREGANSGYPDCNRAYIDSVQTVIRLDLHNPSFSIQTPLIDMSKAETMELADSLGELEFLLQNTVTCYNGVPITGCRACPSCRLRNEGIVEFYRSHPDRMPPAPFAALMP